MWTSQIGTVIFCPQFQLMIIYIFCMHFVKLELAFCQTNINAHPYHSFNCEALTLLLILSQIPQFALDIHFGHNFFEMPPSSILQQISDHHISLPVLSGDAVLLKLCFHISDVLLLCHCTPPNEKMLTTSRIGIKHHQAWISIYTRMHAWVHMNWMYGKPSAQNMLLPSSIPNIQPTFHILISYFSRTLVLVPPVFCKPFWVLSNYCSSMITEQTNSCHCQYLNHMGTPHLEI